MCKPALQYVCAIASVCVSLRFSMCEPALHEAFLYFDSVPLKK